MNKIELFPTDLWWHDIPVFFDIKESFIKEIYSLKNTVPSVQISNIHGWQSPDIALLNHKSANLRIILSRIQDFIKNEVIQYSYSADVVGLWYNINPPGSANHVHSHPGVDLSGVFYIKVPSPAKKSGVLTIPNPNVYKEFNYGMMSSNNKSFIKYDVEPCEGRFYLFPSHLEHGVLTNETNDDRISFACNIKLR